MAIVPSLSLSHLESAQKMKRVEITERLGVDDAPSNDYTIMLFFCTCGRMDDMLMDKRSQGSSAALEVKKQGGGFNHNFTSEAHSVQLLTYFFYGDGTAFAFRRTELSKLFSLFFYSVERDGIRQSLEEIKALETELVKKQQPRGTAEDVGNKILKLMAFIKILSDSYNGENVNYAADDSVKIRTRLAGHWLLYKRHLSNTSIQALFLSRMAYNKAWILAACLIIMAIAVSAHEGHDHEGPTPAPSKGGSSSLASPFPAALIICVVGFVFSIAKI
ncbi:hypothetical protein Cgig2_007010 [Carnegiea gigantea]|uniref:Uncharacterized protein n=1 Tax=Carnegiea gigantea TaxID=171969 RepID=A0A9Q1K9X6_9CARY|nr:hypothetical protein Cgig2_007010 [Carnegiea gigantea]